VIIAARLFGSPHTHKKSHEPEPVALFEEPARCTGPAATLAAAQELAEGAAAKKDRFPFSVIDGIQAVQIFGSAEACFSAAGADDRAAAARAARLALKTRIEDDYRILRARLAWALEQGRMETAMESTQLLLVYVSHRDGPYRQWLLGMAAQLKPRAEQERAKAKKEQEAKDKKRRRM